MHRVSVYQVVLLDFTLDYLLCDWPKLLLNNTFKMFTIKDEEGTYYIPTIEMREYVMRDPMKAWKTAGKQSDFPTIIISEITKNNLFFIRLLHLLSWCHSSRSVAASAYSGPVCW